MFPLLCRSFSMWHDPIGQFLPLLPELLEPYTESHYLGLRLQVFPLCFLIAIFKCFRFYIKVFDSFWTDFCMVWEIRIQFQSFICGYPVFPRPMLERLFSLQHMFWHLSWQSVGCGTSVYVWVIYSTLLVLCLFCSRTMLFSYWGSLV
jgi:hypothetical protein